MTTPTPTPTPPARSATPRSQPAQGAGAGRRPSRWAWVRALWLLAGGLALVTGVVGIFLPLLPTTPFVLLAAFCFSRGSARWEAWLVHHPRLGPMVRDWRATRAVPLRAKQLATVMMSLSCLWAWFSIPSAWRVMPALCCACVAAWLWSLPTRRASNLPPS